MTRILLITLLFITTLNINAQKNVRQSLSTAKEYIKKESNLDKAETMMRTLLKDSANKQNEKIWNLLCQSLKKQYEQENEKFYLSKKPIFEKIVSSQKRQQVDTTKFFNITKRLFDAYQGFDSIDIKQKHREENATYLYPLRANLYSAGLYHINKHDYKTAATFLNEYLDTRKAPLFTSFSENNDTLASHAAYWLVFCAYNNQDHATVLRNYPLAMTDTLHQPYLLQYVSETYKQQNDTANYLATLEKGYNLKPLQPYFFSALYQHSMHADDFKTAHKLAAQAHHNYPQDTIYALALCGVNLQEGNYDEVITLSDTLLQRDSTIADAYSYAGLARFYKATANRQSLNHTKQYRKKVLQCYQQALPYLERYRTMRPNQKRIWGLPLYTIYLNLNRGKQFEEIEQLLKKNQ